MAITFVDAGVLIAAARGREELALAAIAILDDLDRSFASSDFVRLEILPKALFNGKIQEAQFYEEFFGAVSLWPADIGRVVTHASDLGTKFGLAALDALHVAAAVSVGAEEFITTEKPDKPLHRVTDIRVRSTHPG